MKFYYLNEEKYIYLETLGEGAQGKVVKVENELKNRVFALKLLNSSHVDREEREISAMQYLNHSNISQIYGAAFSDKVTYILMQYMKHGSIQEYIQKHILGIQKKLFMIQDVANALKYIHGENFIHRDIKPQNIFVHDDGHGTYACLGDFGLVKNLNASTEVTQGVVGTYSYMPFEIFNGDEVHTYESDIYSLGMSMYKILVGKHAYDISSVGKLYEELKEKEIVAPSVYNSSISKELDELCLKSIAKNKEERYQSIDDFIKDLRNCIQSFSNDSSYNLANESKPKDQLKKDNEEKSSESEMIDFEMLDTNIGGTDVLEGNEKEGHNLSIEEYFKKYEKPLEGAWKKMQEASRKADRKEKEDELGLEAVIGYASCNNNPSRHVRSNIEQKARTKREQPIYEGSSGLLKDREEKYYAYITYDEHETLDLGRLKKVSEIEEKCLVEVKYVSE